MSPGRVALWLAAGRVVRTGFSFVIPMLLARTLTQAEYGEFKQIDLVAPLLSSVFLLGFDRSLTNFLPRAGSLPRRETSTAFWAVTGVSVAASGLMAALPAIPRTLLSSSAPLIIGVATFSYGVSGAFTPLLQRTLIATGRGRAAAVMPTLLDLPYVIGMLIASVLGASLRTCALVVTAHGLLVCLVAGATLARHRLLGFHFDREVLRRHLAFATPLWLVGLVQAWGQRIDRFLVTASLGSTEFAIYAIGLTGFRRLLVLPASYRDAMAPQFARYEDKGKREKIARLYQSSCETLLPICLLMAACQVHMGHLLVPLMYTDKFTASVGVFQVAAISTALSIFAGLESILRAYAAFRFIATLAAGTLAAKLGLGLLVLPLRSLELQALVQSLTGVGAMAVYLVYVRRRLEVGWLELLPRRGLGTTALMTAVCVLVTWLLEPRLQALSLLPRTVFLCVPWGLAALFALHRLRQARRRSAAEAKASSLAEPAGDVDDVGPGPA